MKYLIFLQILFKNKDGESLIKSSHSFLLGTFFKSICFLKNVIAVVFSLIVHGIMFTFFFSLDGFWCFGLCNFSFSL